MKIANKEIYDWREECKKKGVEVEYMLRYAWGNVWYKTKYPNWCDFGTYVIPDEYVHLRKALVDGRGIEFYIKDKWISAENVDTNITPNRYRIKPIAYIFNIGDWIVVNNNNILITKENRKQFNKDFKLWKPKENEFCVFLVEEDIYLVKRYTKSTNKCMPLEYLETIK